MKKRFAFTLAEVLITLGIIGVVAAMTIPSLIQSYNRHIVETSLRKIYSTMNQAIKLSEEENGGRESWFLADSASPNQDEQLEWINKYLIPYFSGARAELIQNGDRTTAFIVFNNGSLLGPQAVNHISDWAFFPRNSKRCLKQYYWVRTGNCAFSFHWYPVNKTPNQWGYNFEPFAYPNGTTTSIDTLKNHQNYGCYTPHSTGQSWHGYCTELIRRNNWKIPKDYPYKVLSY